MGDSEEPFDPVIGAIINNAYVDRREAEEKKSTGKMEKKRLRSYTVEFKLSAIACEKRYGVRKTARFFNVDPKRIREWKKTEIELKLVDKTGIKKRKIHPGPTFEAQVTRIMNRFKYKAIFVDLLDTMTDWRQPIQRAFGRIVKEFVTPGETGFTSLSESWNDLIQQDIYKIRHGTMRFMPLDQIHRRTLTCLLRKYSMSLLDDQFDTLLHSWDRSRAWALEDAHLLENLREKYIVACVGNANIGLATRISRRNGFTWDAVLGAELVEQYTPDSHVYAKAANILDVPFTDCTLITSCPDALRNAKELRMKTCFIRRQCESTERPLDAIDIETNSNIVVSSFKEATARLCATSLLSATEEDTGWGEY